MDDITASVVELYQQYPYPTYGNHSDYFETFLQPVMEEVGPLSSMLEAGCGTGCVTVDLATAMPATKIVAFDLSEPSLAYARRLMQQREITNAHVERRNFLDANDDLRGFDFVYSHGVLQTLSDTALGARRLFEFVRPGGHVYVWTYSTLGRRELEDLREALRILQIGPDHPDRLELVRTLAPPHFARKVYRENMSADESLIHLHDVVYHPHDVDFRVDQLYDLFEGAGFDVVRLVEANGELWPSVEAMPWSREIKDLSASLPQRQCDALIELTLKPAGFGVLLRRPSEVASR
ncbi:class I SAM-dependent methyltransferase [Streptomyces sp. MB09-02B]|uniref:class I SAM-dependent methyltransferase n=1 Tax=Streptomyces sp. MB09-02B TaxID=3028667 RepID=UPI0029B3BF1A|nr:class I SAM-dependent methyltransferase [Streptomyces sp. MB09-02B]MDX3638414.1 class I SAM-dependent methyltransferase [Streptomyces sp. MB09-02B]